MLELTSSHSEGEASLNSTTLPIGSIVRALCQAANAGPDLLYEVMLKLSLLVEATAPMYGLSIWTVDDAQKPTLNWAEGLDETELAVGESVVQTTLSAGTWPETSEGDPSICFVLASSKPPSTSVTKPHFRTGYKRISFAEVLSFQSPSAVA